MELPALGTIYTVVGVDDGDATLVASEGNDDDLVEVGTDADGAEADAAPSAAAAD